jgi:hypothetical protein
LDLYEGKSRLGIKVAFRSYRARLPPTPRLSWIVYYYPDGLLGGPLQPTAGGLGTLLKRLGLVACLVLAVIAIAKRRDWLPTERPTNVIAGAPIASEKHAPKSTSSPQPSAGPDLRARLDAGFTGQSANDPDYLAAAKLITPAPPQTPLALQGVDPRRLRASFQRGVTAMRSDAADQSATGARLVSVAAILGYQPARLLIVQRYPSSAILRSTVSSAEAVRYSFDPLLLPSAQSEGNRNSLVLLTAYFSGRQALVDYASDVLAVLGDDKRLQTSERLQILLNLLARVRGTCTAITVTIAKARTMTGPECSPALQLQIENYLHVIPPPGRETESRREALRLLDGFAEFERSDMRSPAPN